MKKKIYILLGLFSVFEMLQAQHTLNSVFNLPRVGDEIIKQQVEYKNPGRSGEKVIWDFSRLELINDEYSLIYSSPELTEETNSYIMGRDSIPAGYLNEADLLIGTEHNTMYYYRVQDHCLWSLGHENPTVLLHYTQPFVSEFYPMNYRDSLDSTYEAEGLYSSSIPFDIKGSVWIKSDAYGLMILPSGDTLQHVVRVRSEREVQQQIKMDSGEEIVNNSVLETYRWYSKGYRYPIFETVRTFNVVANEEIDYFCTAFFYPPQDHYYLDNDEDNLQLQGENVSSDPWLNLRYNIYPNPVRTNLEVEFYLPQSAFIRVQVRTLLGMIVLETNEGRYLEGVGTFQLNTMVLPTGNYILDIWLNDHLVSEIIMKR